MTCFKKRGADDDLFSAAFVVTTLSASGCTGVLDLEWQSMHLFQGNKISKIVVVVLVCTARQSEFTFQTFSKMVVWQFPIHAWWHYVVLFQLTNHS